MSENQVRKRKADDLELVVDPDADAQQVTGTNASVPSSSGASAEPTATSTFGGGFSAYAKTNPFAAATANLKPSFGGGFGGGFGSGFGSSNGGGFGSAGGFGGGFGSSAISVNTAPAIPTPTPAVTSSLSISTALPPAQMPSQLSSAGRQNFNMPPPLVVPSPKSPKLNPFSSPSPVHNPFMTIVESKDELWKTMAKDKLSDEEAAKSTALLTGVNNSNKKSRLASYGGGSSYFGDSSYYPASLAPGGPTTDTEEGEEVKKEEEEADTANNNDDDENNEDPEADENNNEGSPGKMYTTYSLPENVVVVTGEEQDECLLQIRVKLYRLGVKQATGKNKKKTGDDDEEKKQEDVKIDIAAAEWIEVGIGPLKILRQKAEDHTSADNHTDANNSKQSHGSSSSRLVMRREEKKGGIGTKLLLNVRLNQFVSVAKQGDKMIRIVCINYADPVLGTSNNNSKEAQLQSYLIKTKTAKEFEDLLSYMEESIESAKKQTASSSSQPAEDTTKSASSTTASEDQ